MLEYDVEDGEDEFFDANDGSEGIANLRYIAPRATTGDEK